MTEEDKSTFLSAMVDVTPLTNRKKVNQYRQKMVQAKAQATLKQLRANQRHEHQYAPIEKQERADSIPSVGPFERLLYHKKGLRLQELSKLKKGEFSIEDELDLHGETLETAEQKVQAFITQAYHHKYRYVRIIHGKGYNSNESLPIIKNFVNQELRCLKVVIAFCSAPEKDGGTGAVNIFLKAH